MSPVAWVWTLVILYWIYCIYWGIRGAMVSKTASGYMVGGRAIPMWIFILAATATSFSGWTFIGHPGLIWRDGLSYAFASFYVLTIPITGTWFAKRQWLLGKRYGFITPGDMYAYYYGSEVMRWLVVIVAVLYSSFYSAVQLIASGNLFHLVTGKQVSILWGSILLGAIVVFYVAAGGLRSVAWVDALQCILLILGIIVLGMFVLHSAGGWAFLSQKINALDAKYLTIPGGPGATAGSNGMMQFTSGKTIWTGMMILTYMFSLMGIQASPAFTMWSFSNKNPRPFPWQQAIASTFFVGFALFFFTAIQGMGGRVVMDEVSKALGVVVSDRNLVPALMEHYLPGFWLAFVTIGALAAMQSTAAPYIATGSTILARDVYFRYMRPMAGHAEQIWMSRVFAVIIAAVALLISLKSASAMVMLGGLATAFGTLMYITLLGVCYGWPVRGVGAVVGLAVGIFTVILTDPNINFVLGDWAKGFGFLWTSRRSRRGGRLQRHLQGIARDRRAPARAAGVAQRHRPPVAVAASLAEGHVGGRPPLVSLRHRSLRSHRQHRVLVPRLPSPVGVADRVVATRPRDDVGDVLQGRALVPRRGADPAGREGSEDRGARGRPRDRGW